MKEIRKYLFVCLLVLGCKESDQSTPIEEAVFLKYTNGTVYCEGVQVINPKNKKKNKRIGFWKFYHPNGKLNEHIEYDENGNTVSSKTFDDDGGLTISDIYLEKKTVETYYHDNGKIMAEFITEQKTIDEEQTDFLTQNEYYKNGQLKQRTTYENNIPVGQSTIWDEQGKEILKFEFKNGMITKE